LCTDTNLAPSLQAQVFRSCGLLMLLKWHTDRAVTQINQHTPPLISESFDSGFDGGRTTKYVFDDIAAMQTRGYVITLAQFADNKSQVMNRIKWGRVGIALNRTPICIDNEG
jgi:hypothetical protein